MKKNTHVAKAKSALLGAKRPLILAGAGVRCAGAVDDLLAFAHETNIPTITSRLGMDLVGTTGHLD